MCYKYKKRSPLQDISIFRRNMRQELRLGVFVNHELCKNLHELKNINHIPTCTRLHYNASKTTNKIFSPLHSSWFISYVNSDRKVHSNRLGLPKPFHWLTSGCGLFLYIQHSKAYQYPFKKCIFFRW